MAIMLRRGSSGPAVRELQGNLRTSGFPIRVDGSFGPETEKAVRAFQAKNRQQVDGIVARHRQRLLDRPAMRHGVPRRAQLQRDLLRGARIVLDQQYLRHRACSPYPRRGVNPVTASLGPNRGPNRGM